MASNCLFRGKHIGCSRTGLVAFNQSTSYLWVHKSNFFTIPRSRDERCYSIALLGLFHAGQFSDSAIPTPAHQYEQHPSCLQRCPRVRARAIFPAGLDQPKVAVDNIAWIYAKTVDNRRCCMQHNPCIRKIHPCYLELPY